MMIGDNTGGAPFLELVFSEFESAPREGGLKKNVYPIHLGFSLCMTGTGS